VQRAQREEVPVAAERVDLALAQALHVPPSARLVGFRGPGPYDGTRDAGPPIAGARRERGTIHDAHDPRARPDAQPVRRRPATLRLARWPRGVGRESRLRRVPDPGARP